MQCGELRWGPAADPVARLVCGFAPPLRERKIIVVLDGYVDDSGGSGGAGDGDHFLLAGYVASSEPWMRFSEEWDAECGKHPATPDFKMAIAMRPIGSEEGYGWSEEQRERRIESLAEIINRWTRLRVSCVIRRSGYEHIVRGNVPGAIDSAYFLAFYTVIVAVAHYMGQSNLSGSVDWVFDEQGKVGRKARKHFEWIKNHASPAIRPYLGVEPIFRHDSQLLPLKAADMFAWSLRRNHSIEQPANQSTGATLERLLGRKYGVMARIEGKHMEHFVSCLRLGQLAITADIQSHIPIPNARHASGAPD